jgi:asparagine synthase (glutamine-hydrolysing)
MCGIFGYFLFEKNAYDPDVLKRMGDSIVYRGPDDEGFFEDPSLGVGIGNKRLSIIDVTGGHQPFLSEDGKIAVVQNGEIFNYIELADSLRLEGVELKSNSDTEVILKLYERDGIDFIHHLNGMFAIALYDDRVKKLFLIRDRVGVKPLYFFKNDKALYFGSEIKSILSAGVQAKIRIESLYQYFIFNYVPHPLTIFDGIYHVDPGCYLEISNNKVNKHSWWSIKNNKHLNRSESDIICQFNELLFDAVKIRMRSDVPFGAFLSGGVDSSTIVALMSKISKNPISTFSIGFFDERFDETPYAEEAAKLFGTNHQGRKVNSEIIDLWSKMIFHCDQPHGDTSFIPTYIVSMLARDSVKVVLTGDGGDELFGGYDKFPAFLEQMSGQQFSAEEYGRFISVFKPEDISKLFNKSSISPMTDYNPYNVLNNKLSEVTNFDTINKMLYLDFSLLLPGNNLVKPDRMGMAASIEARTPFLDYRMVEFAFSIPGNLKVNNGQTKYIYKKAVENIIGNSLTYRKKQMFTVPMGEWIKTTLKKTVQDMLIGDSYIQNYLNMDFVSTLFNDHLSGRDRTRQVRQLMAFEYWCREFLA